MASAEETLRRALALLDDADLGDPPPIRFESVSRSESEAGDADAGDGGARTANRTAESDGGDEPSAEEIARRVRAGAMTPESARLPFERRADALDPVLNAFALRTPERAAQETALLRDRGAAGDPLPLAGVPIGHKDILDTAGIVTAGGSRALANRVPTRDATVVEHLAAAGAIVLGKLNTHELATGITGTVCANGPVRNPWDPTRMTGGSSSGSGAAVAAGMVALATGTDTGGSVRIPAACCGVVGMKPSYGRIDTAGVIAFSTTLDHVGVLARRVDDVELGLAVMAGGEPSCSGRRADAAGLRIGLVSAWLRSAQPAVADAVRVAVATLERLGATVVEMELPASTALVDAAAAAIFLSEGAANHAELLRDRPEQLQPPTRKLLALASAVSEERVARARRARRRIAADLAELFRTIDVLAGPTIPTTAPAADAAVVELPDGEIDVRAALTRTTRLANLTGVPAASVPCGFEGGLPIGLQLVGPMGRDRRVLEVARMLEAVSGRDRWPPGVGQELASRAERTRTQQPHEQP